MRKKMTMTSTFTKLCAGTLLGGSLVAFSGCPVGAPEINYNAGRDHHPAVFSAALAGGGIKGGQLYGRSDSAGHSVEENGVTPADFNATIAASLGLPLEEVITSPTGRPFTVAHEGKPVEALMA